MNELNNNYAHKGRHFNLTKFNKMMTMSPFKDATTFEKWLKTNNLSYENFLHFFYKYHSSNDLTDNNPWIDYLYNSYVPGIKIPKHYINPLGVIVDFMIEKATFEFKHNMFNLKRKHKSKIKPALFKNEFIHELSQLLSAIVSPFLDLEFSISCRLKEILGKNVNEQFNNYINLLTKKDYIISIFKEYPFLLERLTSKTTETSSESFQLFRRLTKEYKDMCQCFGELGTLCGFFHVRSNDCRFTRTIKICQFENKAILYNPDPKSNAADTQKLIINKKNHYWQEFIEDTAYQSITKSSWG